MALHRAAWVRWRCGVELDIALSDAVRTFKVYEACDDGASDLVVERCLAVLKLAADLFDALGEPDHGRAPAAAQRKLSHEHNRMGTRESASPLVVQQTKTQPGPTLSALIPLA